MTQTSTNERRPPLHAFQPAHRTATRWLVAIVGSVALLLATPAPSHAEESNPNNYTCRGLIGAGSPEVGSEEQQVKYTFFCNGPITGYQLQSQIPLTGVEAAPLVSSLRCRDPPEGHLLLLGRNPGLRGQLRGRDQRRVRAGDG